MKINIYKIAFIITILLNSFIGSAYDSDLKVPALSSNSKVSLLTVGRADNAIYQNFGHTAIRVKDSILGWDLVYNYGTFNYPGDNFKDQFAFVKKFTQAKLLYYESIDDFPVFEDMYREENRWIREQALNLTQEQKQTLFEKLTINAREENKYYRYDFLFDNCSTRPRNIILSLFKTKQFIADIDDNSSFRKLIDRNVPNEWLDLGMDLLIGLPTDKNAGYNRTFLPEELMQLFDSAMVDGKPLVSGNSLILSSVPETNKIIWLTPNLIFWLLFFIIFMVQIKTKLFSRFKILPVLYFTILGLFGWLFLFMWFGTLHSTTKWNFNILWAMPLNIPVLFLLLKNEIPKSALTFIKIYRIILIILLIGWWLNPQTFHISVIPLILIAILFTSIFLRVPTKADFDKRLIGKNEVGKLN